MGALTAPVTAAHAREFRRRSLLAERGGVLDRLRRRQVLFGAVGTGIIVVACLFAATRLALDPHTAASAGGISRARVIAFAIVMLVLVALGVTAAVLRWRSHRTWVRRLRLDAFARANGFGIVFESGTPDYPGALFRGVAHAVARDRLHVLTGRALELGRYGYQSRFGASVSRREWAYLALRLDDVVPQIVLEARAHRGMLSTTGTPNAYRTNPATDIRGGSIRGPERFTLYCPPGAERDARAILTPRLIALLGSGDDTVDVELVDRWLFAYAPQPWDLADPAVLLRLFGIADEVCAGLHDDAGNDAAADWPGERPAGR